MESGIACVVMGNADFCVEFCLKSEQLNRKVRVLQILKSKKPKFNAATY